MLTFKQMEALYWIVQLGSFEAAARRLNATQSAVSKRVQELERIFDIEVFDRTHRSARLTEKGSEIFEYAKEFLERRDQIVERISSKDVLVKQVRIGVTELTALTWLPRLIAAIQAEYPKAKVEAEVDLTATLRERLAADTIDLIVVPQTHGTEQVTMAGALQNRFQSATLSLYTKQQWSERPATRSAPEHVASARKMLIIVCRIIVCNDGHLPHVRQAPRMPTRCSLR